MFQVGKRRLGRDGPEVSAIGLGCMDMSEFYVGGSEAESIATIHHALDRGVNFLDTADMYGWGKNEELVGRAIADRRGEPEAAERRRHRPLLPAPRRPDRADRGYGRRDVAAEGRGEGALPRAVG